MRGKTYLAAFLMGLVLVGGAHAGLVGVVNPSFEDDVLYAGTRTPAISGWYNRSAYCYATEETYAETNAIYPMTPYGSNWAGLGRRSWVYQQIGTWEENLELEISLLTGSVAGKDYTGFHISLWAGGDPTQAADADIFPSTTLSNNVGATMIAMSDRILPESVLSDFYGRYGYLGNATTAPVSVRLSTGTGYSDGDALWLLIQAAGRKRVLIDDVSVAVVPEPATLLLLWLGGLMVRRRKTL